MTKLKNTLYAVAGNRNIRLAQSDLLTGLYVNVGMTKRSVDDRLSDSSYNSKSNNGDWIKLCEFDIGDNTDHDIHELLREHPDVDHTVDSCNSEEFEFLLDAGDGVEVSRILEGIVKKLMLKNMNIVQKNDFIKLNDDLNLPYATAWNGEPNIIFQVKHSKKQLYKKRQPKNAPDNKKYYTCVRFKNQSQKYEFINIWTDNVDIFVKGSVWIGKCSCMKNGQLQAHLNGLTRIDNLKDAGKAIVSSNQITEYSVYDNLDIHEEAYEYIDNNPYYTSQCYYRSFSNKKTETPLLVLTPGEIVNRVNEKAKRRLNSIVYKQNKKSNVSVMTFCCVLLTVFLLSKVI